MLPPCHHPSEKQENQEWIEHLKGNISLIKQDRHGQDRSFRSFIGAFSSWRCLQDLDLIWSYLIMSDHICFDHIWYDLIISYLIWSDHIGSYDLIIWSDHMIWSYDLIISDMIWSDKIWSDLIMSSLVLSFLVLSYLSNPIHLERDVLPHCPWPIRLPRRKKIKNEFYIWFAIYLILNKIEMVEL